MPLLKKQTNDLYKAIEAEGFDAKTDFKFERNAFDTSDGKMVYTGSPDPFEAWTFDFKWSTDGHLWIVEYTPGSGQFESGRQLATTWVTLIHHFRSWVHAIKAEVEEPDLWSQASALAKIPNVANERFTTAEIKQLAAKIDDVKRKVDASPDVTPEAKQIVGAIMTEHVETAPYLTKKIWFDALFGQLVRKMVDGVIDPITIQWIWMQVVDLVIKLLGP